MPSTAPAVLSVVPTTRRAALAATLGQVRRELEAAVYGQSAAVEVLLLATAARTHALVVGPPGEGKSYLVDLLAGHFAGARVYKTVGYPEMGDDDLVGPYDLAALSEVPARTARQTAGYLPEAHFAFVDEAMRLGGHSRDRLLPMMAEREVQLGNVRTRLPLHSMYLASNTWPTEEADMAFFDRCALRLVVAQPSTADVVRAMYTRPAAGTTQLSLADLAELAGEVREGTSVPAHIVEATGAFIEALAELGLRNSTRRWCWCVPVLQAAAFLRGDTAVTEDDFLALRYVLATSTADVARVEAAATSIQPAYIKTSLAERDAAKKVFEEFVVAAARAKTLAPAANASAGARESAAAAQEEALDAAGKVALRANRHLGAARKRLAEVIEAARASGRSTAPVERALAQLQDMTKQVASFLNV